MRALILDPRIEHYRKDLIDNALPCIKLYDELRETTVTDSKFGGLPYLPNGIEFPKDSLGNLLILMAQINFSQLPANEKYPKKGILSFYISNTLFDDEWSFGMDSRDFTKQENWRLLWFPEPDQSKSQTDFFAYQQYLARAENHTPFHKLTDSFAITFDTDISVPSPQDHRSYDFLDKLISKELGYTKPRKEVVRELYAINDNDKLREHAKIYNAFYKAYYDSHINQIGGYVGFEQFSPEMDSPFLNPESESLLQIASYNGNTQFNWLDGGIAHLFIPTTDLKKQDFSHVTFYWDCG